MDFTANINPNSVEILHDCRIEASFEKSEVGDFFQFERLGYFNVDTDTKETKLVFNRSVSLKDSWSRMQSGTKNK